MKAKVLILTISILTLFYPNTVFSQCIPGEAEVELKVITDLYGYEGYWEIVPAGNACGSGTIDNGGNDLVGCTGGGDQNQDPGGYGNNLEITEGPWCISTGTSLDLIYVDDWGDGGFDFEVLINGIVTESFDGMLAGGTFTFVVEDPPLYDVSLESLVNPVEYTAAGDQNITVTLFNAGSEQINEVELTYTVNGGSAVSAEVTGLAINNFTSAEIVHPTPWNASDLGNYTIEVTIVSLNGNADENPGDNSLSKTVEVGPGIPNVIDYYIGGATTEIEIGSASDGLNGPTDLDFHPYLNKNQLWVINRRIEAIGGSTVTFYNTGESSQESLERVDGNAWHFMSLPNGIAFGDNDFFATASGVYDANHDGGLAFTGPSLWTSDSSIYAQPSGGNGSHMDMLHESPFCQGIAHEIGNAYWVFDGYNSDIVRYDFVEDHGPGNDDHSDAIIRRYSDESVAMDAGNHVVSHLILDKKTDWLYVVDNGNQRIIRMDINSGTTGGTPTYGPYEALAEYVNITGYTWETVVDDGLLNPAGVDIIGNRMVVSDYSTGEIIIYDITVAPAIEMGRISTTAEGIMGLKIGPNGMIYYVDYDADKVIMLRADNVSGIEESDLLNSNIFPNPNTGENININLAESGNYQINLINSLGQLIMTRSFYGESTILKNELNPGTYFLEIMDLNASKRSVEKLIIQNK